MVAGRIFIIENSARGKSGLHVRQDSI